MAAHGIDIDIAQLRQVDLEILDPDAFVTHVHRVGMLGKHAQAHVFHHRKRIRQRNGLAESEQLEAQRLPATTTRAREAQAKVVRTHDFRGILDVDCGNARRDFLDVARRQRPAEPLGQLESAILAMAVDQDVAQLVMPVADDLRELGFQLFLVEIHHIARLGADDQM